MKRLVIVGAGISGLSAAHEATRRAADVPGGLEVLVLEAGTEVGGKARSVRQAGWLVEEGPTGYLDSEPEFDDLLTRSGLAEHKVTANDAAARRYLMHGRLRELKAGPLAFAASGILSAGGLLRIAAEPFISKASEQQAAAESIWDFAARRLGPQAAERLIAPMVLGVFAGNARELSLIACFPKLANLEREHGSLIRGMLATRTSRSKDQRFATGPSGKLVSANAGLQSLPRMLAEVGSFTTRCNARVRGIEESPKRDEAGCDAPRYRVLVDGDAEAIVGDAVILAGESFANADLIAGVNPEVADALQEIRTPPVVVVAMGFGPEVAQRFPTGFGVLIPRDQGYRILGCIWDSQLFARRSPDGHLLVRAMLGGGVDPDVASLGDAQLAELTYSELSRIFGLRERPLFSRVANWDRAIPQYDVDHPRRIERIASALSRSPGVFLAGNGLHGVAFCKSAVTGIRQGRGATEWLAERARTAAMGPGAEASREAATTAN
jgi:oxygen-dependent protoporphyrinogen oxidase